MQDLVHAGSRAYRISCIPAVRPSPGVRSFCRSTRRLPFAWQIGEEPKFPLAAASRSRIGGSVDAHGDDPGIDRLRKTGIFYDPHSLTGKRRQALAFPRFLDPAVDHPKAQRLFVDAMAFLTVDGGIKSVCKRTGESVKPAPLGDLKGLHDAPGFHRGKAGPRLRIELNCRIHAEPLLSGEKPAAVMSEPVLGVEPHQLEQIAAGQLVDGHDRPCDSLARSVESEVLTAAPHFDAAAFSLTNPPSTDRIIAPLPSFFMPFLSFFMSFYFCRMPDSVGRSNHTHAEASARSDVMLVAQPPPELTAELERTIP